MAVYGLEQSADVDVRAGDWIFILSSYRSCRSSILGSREKQSIRVSVLS